MQDKARLRSLLLLVQIFVVSTCSLTYELLLGTVYSNITSNSVFSYSLVIGLFLAGLGSGSFLSKYIPDNRLVDTFIWVETTLAIIGGFSVFLLYSSFVFTPYFQLAQVLLTFGVGALSGLEIPTLTRILDHNKSTPLKGILANVLSFDYLGGLAASLLFPLFLLPYFGAVRLNFLTGIINALMAMLGLWLFWRLANQKWMHGVAIGIAFISLVCAAIFSGQMYNFVESRLYRDPIVYSSQSKYQRIVVTHRENDTRLYLNGSIQFSTQDEYRYHESLVFPAMMTYLNTTLMICSQNPCQPNLQIAIFGGGDGLAVRELLKFGDLIKKIYLIDIDPAITDLAKYNRLFTEINHNSLQHPKVEILNQDAWAWIKNQPSGSLDVIISDLPDPDDTALAKLYSKEFYTFSSAALKKHSLLVTQSSSPYSTPKSFWGINRTLDSVFETVLPYQTYVPSFGLWGFNLASKGILDINTIDHSLNPSLTKFLDSNKFIDQKTIKSIFELEPDLKNPVLSNGKPLDKNQIKVNTLDNLILTNYYQEAGSEVQ